MRVFHFDLEPPFFFGNSSKGAKISANSSYFKICPEMIWLRHMELVVGSSYDVYVILSNHYEIAAKAHHSHGWR